MLRSGTAPSIYDAIVATVRTTLGGGAGTSTTPRFHSHSVTRQRARRPCSEGASILTRCFHRDSSEIQTPLPLSRCCHTNTVLLGARSFTTRRSTAKPPAPKPPQNPTPEASRVLKNDWTDEEKRYMASIDEQLMALPLVKQLLSPHGVRPDGGPDGHPDAATAAASSSSPKGSAYTVYRPYLNFPRAKLEHHMTAGQLRGPGKFAIAPLALIRQPGARASSDGQAQGAAVSASKAGDAFVFFHLGQSLCGHEGIIHGGLLATLCDEALAITGFRHFSSRVGVTVRLEVDYRSPAFPDRFVVMQTELIEGESTSSRKAVVRGKMWDVQDGRTIVDAKAVFVEPRDEKLGKSLAGSANASSS